MPASKSNPDHPASNSDCSCDPEKGPSGPPREAGGTTGEGNLSPEQSNRTGGATSGVGDESQRPARAGTIPPDA